MGKIPSVLWLHGRHGRRSRGVVVHHGGDLGMKFAAERELAKIHLTIFPLVWYNGTRKEGRHERRDFEILLQKI